MTAPESVPARRPRNAAATRAAILEAATIRFAQDGYDQVGVRDIAAGAGIDPALVNRYFGSKEGLFQAVQSSIARGPSQFDGPPEELGERLARMVLRWEGERAQSQLTAIEIAIRSTTSPTAQAIVREDIERRFVKPLAERLGPGEDAAVRAQLAVAIIMGGGVIRGVLGEAEPARQHREAMIVHLAPMLQRLLDPVS